ncbi:MAG TPA: WbqC family protein [Bacteroidia bacterium]|nr:WbqC family protein [Bacteroidia bacterium]
MTALIELHYLPCIEYMHTLNTHAKILFEGHEYFVKQTWRNRSRIYGANGAQDLILPVKNKSAKIPAKDIEIAYYENWQHNHWMSVHSGYRSSPYYDYYEEEIKGLFFKQEKYLFDYNLLWLEWITKTLKISIDYLLTEEYRPAAEPGIADLRNTISPKKPTVFSHPNYHQVFEDKHGFIPNLSVLDWIFNDLSGARNYLSKR